MEITQLIDLSYVITMDIWPLRRKWRIDELSELCSGVRLCSVFAMSRGGGFVLSLLT
jgi:hypothetical protein